MVSDLSDSRWEAFAAREPYFAVLTAPEFLRANLTAEHERQFFASGEALVAHIFRLTEERLAPDFAPTSLLEYGCGAGRLIGPLAQRAARRGGLLVAVDRSPAMRAVAAETIERHSLTNVLLQSAAEFAASARTFDFISCYLVLQRLSEADGLELVRTLIRRLAPGGIGVFYVPYRTSGTWPIRFLRWGRERFPPLNRVVNLARGKPGDEPFFPTESYELSRLMGVVHEQLPSTVNVVLEPHDGVDTALLFVEAPLPTQKDAAKALAAGAANRATAAPPIDVRTVIAGTSIDELNAAAEEYFATLTDYDHQLTKPFSQPHEMATLLEGMAAVLHGLNLSPGQTVLEFGAGTGWLSRFLTQLGCRVILLDVSPTALRIARELYDRLPIIGTRPAPQFLTFDGRRIDLPDAAVDRILCFHAFHHTPNPDDVLREFARVLAPGGVAGFAEPGPGHSRSPFSQFEMRTYKVVENDIDVHALWRTAQAAGFSDLKLAVFNSPPLLASLAEFEDFLAGGVATGPWTASTRVFLRNARTFFLTKAGAARFDSRRADGLGSTISAALVAGTVRAGDAIEIDATVANAGTAVWLPSDQPYGGVRLGTHLYDGQGQLLNFDFQTMAITEPPRELAPGDTASCRMRLPLLPPGRYIIELDCVAAQVAWFSPLGSKPVRLPFEVVD